MKDFHVVTRAGASLSSSSDLPEALRDARSRGARIGASGLYDVYVMAIDDRGKLEIEGDLKRVAEVALASEGMRSPPANPETFYALPNILSRRAIKYGYSPEKEWEIYYGGGIDYAGKFSRLVGRKVVGNKIPADLHGQFVAPNGLRVVVTPGVTSRRATRTVNYGLDAGGIHEVPFTILSNFKHRVLVLCPWDGELVPFGRVGQHKHKTKQAPRGRRVRDTVEKEPRGYETRDSREASSRSGRFKARKGHPTRCSCRTCA